MMCPASQSPPGTGNSQFLGMSRLGSHWPRAGVDMPALLFHKEPAKGMLIAPDIFGWHFLFFAGS